MSITTLRTIQPENWVARVPVSSHKNDLPRRYEEGDMRHLGLIAIIGFILTSMLIYLFGDSGIIEFRNLERYRVLLARNNEALKRTGENLSAELAGLKGSDERTIVLARQIGLYRPGDEIMRFENPPSRAESYEVGNLLRLRAGRDRKNPMLKAVGIGASALLAALSLALRAKGAAVGRRAPRWRSS